MWANKQHSIFIQECIQFSMLALFVHDYVLTLPREIEVVWSKLFRVSTVVYFSTRYLPAAGIAYALAKDPVKDHNRVFIVMLVITTIIRIGIMATLIARVYIVCTYHRRMVTCCVALWALSSLIFEFFTFASDRHARKCMLINLFATIAMRVSFEVLVVIITTIQSVQQFSFRRAFDGSTVIGFLVVNGVMYFTAVFIVESLVTLVMIQIRPQDQLHGITAVIPLPLLGSLVSRFHLNVRGIMNKPYEESYELTGQTPSVVMFAHNPSNHRHKSREIQLGHTTEQECNK